MEREEIEKKVRCACDLLVERDHLLLESGVNERSLTHKLGAYLEAHFHDWDVDCEYNRMSNGEAVVPKSVNLSVENTDTVDTDGKTVYPDVIVHHRNERGSDNNLLVIEAKKVGNSTSHDEVKLKAMTKPDGEFQYRFGLQIVFTKTGYKDFRWWVNGEEVGETV